ncbi:TIGR03620 family F420-dependent LLM class oxidoreductase [Promicromonospora sukumoe]|uniref:TIGR03620 family F420-dependent LLM class oxidoreductase n=1 Tax=Promicromonospora sukumoe TaxID=88382 RepID=UPI0003A19CDF|nr:TIGR03620 family F420-dependent LLM class oxidoreductase [Promicromonospora sukumoe]
MAGRELAGRLGPLGVWSMRLRSADRPEAQEAAAELDELGLRTLWIPGLDGKGALDDAGHLLRAPPRSTVTLGVLGIWGTPAGEVANEMARLDRLHGPRTVLGLGISDPRSARSHGQPFGRPVDSMTRYLDDLDAAPVPVPAERRLLGALGPRMAALGAARTGGTHPFLVPPRYTADLRATLGPDPLVAPHQAVVLDTEPDRARATARAGVGMFVGLPAYRNNLRRLGFGDDDLVPGGSDRLVDSLVARGDLDAIRERLREHLDAGADHVAVHVLGSADLPMPAWRELAALAPSLADA